MGELRWRAFFICNSVTQPFVHFFPHSTASTAPYPVLTTISIFGPGVKPASVTLEGARLSQPDGVRLDAIFDTLTQGVQGLVGIEVTLEPRQRRMDLSASQVVIELVQGRSSTRYYASLVDEDAPCAAVSLPAAANDALQPTVVAVNGSDSAVKASIAAGNEGQREVAIEARSLKEISVSGARSLQNTAAVEAETDGDGAVVTESQRFAPATATQMTSDCSVMTRTEEKGLSFFALYRDVQSKAPVNVMAL